ncbi:hypothetical protein G6F58_013849 [Rhizopus delemar]|nr:hypothetical protein G6F58_013849 [Rhizopus delemar]
MGAVRAGVAEDLDHFDLPGQRLERARLGDALVVFAFHQRCVGRGGGTGGQRQQDQQGQQQAGNQPHRHASPLKKATPARSPA